MLRFVLLNQNRLWIFCTALIATISCAASASAQNSVVRIEEDWELVIHSTDAGNAAPQVTTAISPSGGLNSFYATLELNYQSLPDFARGGIQLQIWNGERAHYSRKFPNNSVLNHAGERITWTQVMRLEGNQLTIEVVNGNSTTWGGFGGQGHLQATMTTNFNDLNGYNPSVSVKNSGVGFASNRVQSLILKRVRAYTANEQVSDDQQARVVHQLN